MSTAIVYYSHHGNNKTLAKHLSHRLECGLVPIVEVKPRTGLTILLDILLGRLPRIRTIDTAFREYDHVILVGPVWAGRLAAPLRTFLQLYRQQLRNYSFITLCGYERPEQRAWLMAELERRVGRPPKAVQELCVSDLVPAEQRKSLRRINSYQVEEVELARYRASVDEFLQAVRAQQPLAVMPERAGT